MSYWALLCFIILPIVDNVRTKIMEAGEIYIPDLVK